MKKNFENAANKLISQWEIGLISFHEVLNVVGSSIEAMEKMNQLVNDELITETLEALKEFETIFQNHLINKKILPPRKNSI